MYQHPAKSPACCLLASMVLVWMRVLGSQHRILLQRFMHHLETSRLVLMAVGLVFMSESLFRLTCRSFLASQFRFTISILDRRFLEVLDGVG